MWYLDAAFKGAKIKTFTQLYGNAMQYAQNAYKISQTVPSPALILAQYFYSRKNYSSVLKLAEKVLQHTQLKSLSSDAFYWIGRTHHQLRQYDLAMAFYQKARVSNENNVAAVIGTGQLQVLGGDLITAKLTFERLLEQVPKCIEALTILGFIYANEANERRNKGDTSNERQKASKLFGTAFKLIEETEGRTLDDPNLCLARARECEGEDIDETLKRIPRCK
jgi:RNA polymerase-associated protein CTR9